MMKLYFIGSSSLLLNCVKQALDQGLTVKGIISAGLDINRWADEHRISTLSLSDLIQLSKNSSDFSCTFYKKLSLALCVMYYCLIIKFYTASIGFLK